MQKVLLFPVGITQSCRYASLFLKEAGFTLTDHPTPDVTHLLLDIPSFNTRGQLQDGSELMELLRMLPDRITVIGGNLDCAVLSGYSTMDLLKDDAFLSKNAAITAECALQAAAPYISATFADTSTLILGWGRIGKYLARLLKNLGCRVTVAARNPKDRALLDAFGFRSVEFSRVPQILPEIQLLFNTVPEKSIDSSILNQSSDMVKIELASAPGMTCDECIIARGLPGKYAPESAGKLIAQRLIQFI